MIASGYVQTIQNCAVYQTVLCPICSTFHVPEEGKNCPGCRISELPEILWEYKEVPVENVDKDKDKNADSIKTCINTEIDLGYRFVGYVYSTYIDTKEDLKPQSILFKKEKKKE